MVKKKLYNNDKKDRFLAAVMKTKALFAYCYHHFY